MSRPLRKCRVDGCYRPTHWRTSYCHPHGWRVSLNGHERAIPLRRWSIIKCRREAARLLALYADRPAVRTALELVPMMLLHYPLKPSRHECRLRDQLVALRARCDDLEILTRIVTAYIAFEDRAGQFPVVRAEHVQIGKLLLAPIVRHCDDGVARRVHAVAVRLAGERAAEFFAVFALALIRRAKADEERFFGRRNALSDFNEPTAPIEPEERHG